jgi:hypothetical protein
VLLAALGIVGITGAVMVGTLQAVGWIRQVPDMLRDHPPTESEAWHTFTARLRSFAGMTEESPSSDSAALAGEPAPPSPAAPVTAPRVSEPTQPAPSPRPADVESALNSIEWFDPGAQDPEAQDPEAQSLEAQERSRPR